MKTRPLHGLDLIRFVAAILVMGYHLGVTAWRDPDNVINGWLGADGHVPPWSEVFASGWIGVQIFFVISGFVIANSANGASPYGFAAGRVRRLIPAAWVGGTLALVIVLAWGAVPGKVLRPWLNVMVFYPLGPWLLGQFWTLLVELAFYALILFLLSVDRFRWISAAALAMAVASLAYFGALSAGWDDTHMRVTRLVLLQHGGYFAMGIVMWQLWKFGPSLLRFTTLAIGSAAAVIQIPIAQIAENSAHNGEATAEIPLAVFAISTALLWVSVKLNDRLVWLDAHAKLIRLIGLTTYPLYLIHVHVGGSAMAMLYTKGGSTFAAFARGCFASIFVAAVLAALIEPWGQSILRRIAAWIGAQLAKTRAGAAWALRETQRVSS